MLAKIFPRIHARYSALRVLGPHLEGFVVWLLLQGYPLLPIRLRVRAAEQLDSLLWKRGIRHPGEITVTELLVYAPKDSQENIYLAAVVRSLARYFEDQNALALPPPLTPDQELLASYRTHLQSVRGLAASTLKQHTATVSELLAHLGHSLDTDHLRVLDQSRIEDFLVGMGARLGRESLQHTVAHIRSFLRFLEAHGLAPAGLDTRIDTPRVYRGERLPRSLAWETVRAFLRSIDRSTPMGRRDYAMFLLVVTYGLRTCEVVSLKLKDIDWRAGALRVPRPKVRSTLVLPLTMEVGDAIHAYLRDGRPHLPHPEVFLRARGPAGTLKPTALTEAFQGWTRRSGLPIPYEGPHCLRHSLAVHLLREGASLKTIGDLLGHRSAESTCVYLRLHVEDLREVGLDVPTDDRTEVHP